MAKEVPLDTLETNTTCSHCSVGCSLILESYGDILVKANPDKEGVVNAGLACGKGKWGFVNHFGDSKTAFGKVRKFKYAHRAVPENRFTFEEFVRK